MIKEIFVYLIVLTVVFQSSFVSAAKLDDIKAKGFLRCGVSEGLEGFSIFKESNGWTGLDADLCRAIAAAIFSDPTKVKFNKLSAADRFRAVLSDEIDVLTRNTTWTFLADSKFGLNFAGINFYDGQAFMIRSSMKVTSALELSNATVCTIRGTTTELNVRDYFASNNMKYESIQFVKASEVIEAYRTGVCQVLSMDSSSLYARRSDFELPADHHILPEIISKEPLGPAVRQGDDQWFDIVKWVHNATIIAEEYGITADNVDEFSDSDVPAVRRFLGKDGNFGAALGLSNDWAIDVIRAVGNYGEIYDRNVGENSDIKIPRNLNKLWSEGGLHYAPPFR